MPAGAPGIGARCAVTALEDLRVVEVVQIAAGTEPSAVVGVEPVLVAVVVTACAPGVRPARLGLLGIRAGLGGSEESLDRRRLVDHGGTYEGLVEDHGGELFVHTSAVAVVVGLPAVTRRRAPTSSGTAPE